MLLSRWWCSSEHPTSFHILSILLIYSFCVIKQCEGQMVPVYMYPNTDDLVLQAGATLNLTCTCSLAFSSRANESIIKWTLPDFFTKIDTRINNLDSRLHHSSSRNETHFSSTIVLTKTKPTDTGYYTCASHYDTPFPSDRARKYVYFFDVYNLVVTTTNIGLNTFVIFQEGEPSIIPCIPAHPNVTVTLIREWRYSINGNLPQENEKDLLSQKDSRWNVDQEYRKGLMLHNPTIGDSGCYTCTGTMGNLTGSDTFIVLVKGLELTTIDSSKDPLEGSNVTLHCMNSMSYSPPKWVYTRGENGKSIELNAIKLPEGMTIREKQNNVLKTMQITNFYISKSQLKIDDISLNASGKFQCMSSNGNNFKEIYLRVKEMNSDPVTVQLEEGRPKNLTCIRSSYKYTIQWFKNEEEYSGVVFSSYNSSALLLQGTKDEVGTYACHWNNSLGQARSKYFNVEIFYTNRTDSANRTNVIKVETGGSTSLVITLALFVAVVLLMASVVGLRLYLLKKQRKTILGFKKFTKRNFNGSNKQIDEVPYDERWEFPRHRLKLGEQLGTGCFGLVVKAEAVGIKGSDESVKTVAVKTVKSSNNPDALEDLVSELKVMIHIGSHLNIVNLLGACTKKINRGELLIIIEFCRFGNLQSCLMKNRNSFNNQMDKFGNFPTSTMGEEGFCSSSELLVIEEKTENSCLQDTNGYLVPYGSCNESISTRDLVSWSFQVARGMGYLASKKVLHGDLAARNVLLADNGVVKVADFGMARKMYYESNYKKEGQGLMPIRWMAPESLTDRILSTESDVWSYGVLLWELFSLGKVPYPGIDTKELIQELENGYRMGKPEYAPNFIGDIMMRCWEKEPKDRPNFIQLEEMINCRMESSLSSYYCNLNAYYEKFNTEKATASNTERFGLAKLLEDKPKPKKRFSQLTMRYSRPPEYKNYLPYNDVTSN